MQASDSAYSNLVIPYTITATDNAGNPATSSGNSAIVFYDTLPTVSAVTIASTNSNTALAKIGDTVNIHFTTARDLVALPTVTIDNPPRTATVTPSTLTAGTVYTASLLMTTADTEGVLPFTIDFTDAAGNQGATVTSATGSVTFDKTAPSGYSVAIGQAFIYSGNYGGTDNHRCYICQ